VTQRAGRITHDAHWLSGSNEGLDQLDRTLVLGEIPYRTMAACRAWTTRAGYPPTRSTRSVFRRKRAAAVHFANPALVL
jgi:hypothetical protein